jgi:hypothetical protein
LSVRVGGDEAAVKFTSFVVVIFVTLFLATLFRGPPRRGARF